TARLAERALDAVQSVGEQRSIRYLSSTQSVPPIIWAVLILGAAVILYGSTLASFRYAGASLEILIGISIMLSAVLVAIYTLDRPFGLGAAATTTNYERLRDLLEAGERRTGSASNVHPYMTSGSSGRTDKESPT